MSADVVGSPLVLSGPRLADGRAVDVAVSAGRVTAVGTPGSLTPGAHPAGGRPAGPEGAAIHLDLTGYLLLPAPAEPHAHHETALTARRPGSPPPDTRPAALRSRMTDAALLQLGHGATAQRGHTRIGGVHGLTALEAALDTQRALRGMTQLSVVAMPGPLTGRAGADGRAQLRDAATMGAAVLGGTPDQDPDPAGYLDVLLAAAAEHGLPVDLHTDTSDPARLARLASAVGGLPAGVTVGPCTGLSRMAPGDAELVAERLAAARVVVNCLPQGRCGPSNDPEPFFPTGHRPGPAESLNSAVTAARSPAAHSPTPRDGHGYSRDDHRHSQVSGPAPAPAGHRAEPYAGDGPRVFDGTTPVRLLRSAGVRVTAGSGALRDAANPVGRGDPLEAAYLLAARGAVSPEAAYDTISGQARAAMGLEPVRIEAGFPAELLAVRGESLDGVLSLGYSRIVIHRGRVVSRTRALRDYCDFRPAPGPGPEVPRQTHGPPGPQRG